MMDDIAIVTGGAGFIGSHLCDRLISDYRVVCIDNLSTGKRENFSQLDTNDRFTFVNCDVKQDVIDTLEGANVSIEDVSRIYHLASRASPKDFKEYPVEIAWSSAAGTRNVLELARETDSRLLLTSTSEVYGNPEQHPQSESYNGNVDIRGPRACYDEGKRYSETLASAYLREYDMDVRTVRPFNTYGPRMRENDGRVIPNFITQALEDRPLTVYGDGSQTRSFLYVTDQIEGMIRLMEYPNLSGEIVNIGSTYEITIQKLAEIVLDALDTNSSITKKPLPEDDPERRQPDISKARRVLDWEPTISLQTGLQKTAKAFRHS